MSCLTGAALRAREGITPHGSLCWLGWRLVLTALGRVRKLGL
jgi:hypothetical protein